MSLTRVKSKELSHEEKLHKISEEQRRLRWTPTFFQEDEKYKDLLTPWIGVLENKVVFLKPFKKKCLIFVSPYESQLQEFWNVVGTFEKRYSHYDVQFEVVLYGCSTIFLGSTFFMQWAEDYDVVTPIIFDPLENFKTLFSPELKCFALWFDSEQVAPANFQSENWEGLEEHIQRKLRPDFPGVPFWIPSLVFISGDSQEHWKFISLKTPSSLAGPISFETSGEWGLTEFCIYTKDPKSQLVIRGKAKQVILSVEPYEKEGVDAEISFSGKNLSISTLNLNAPRICKVFEANSSEDFEMHLTFPQARNRAVLIHGVSWI